MRALHRHDLQEIWEPNLAPQIYRQYQNQLLRYLSLAGPTPGLRVLDVGCAQATLALLLAERGHHVVALDLRAEFLDYARGRHEFGDIEFVQGNALETDFDRPFDLIFANQIFEHVLYPEALFERLHGALEAGGRLVVTTPNWHYVRNDLPTFSSLGDRSRLEHLQFTADGDGHFFAYTADELRTLAESAGFVDVDTSYFETPFASGHMKTRYVTRWLPVGLLARADRLVGDIPALGRKLSHQLMLTARRAGSRCS